MDDRDTLLIILGAGASYDCIPVWQLGADDNPRLEVAGLPRLTYRQAVPPLTQNLARAEPLVNWALDRWPQARPAVAHLREVLDEASPAASRATEVVTLEKALAQFEADVDLVPDNARSVLAVRFFLRDLIWAATTYMMCGELTAGITNYTYLLNSVSRWAGHGSRRVVIVTFNYDLLLERAMTSMWGFDPTKLASYLEHARISLLKPHGSLSWEWPLDGNRGILAGDPLTHGRVSIETALQSTELRNDVNIVAQATFEGSRASRPAAVPAMALPVDGKAEFCWPAAQQLHYDELQGRVTRLITIGWRGLEPHFTPTLRPLVKVDARALVLAGGPNGEDEALEARQLLAPHTDCDIARWNPDGRGFTAAIKEGLIDTFLELV